ncbi:MAG: FAD-dependent oxidoreductase, partial [Ferruginibacter sp.]
MKADVIIVGSGLAGISLAFRLIDKGLKVLVISDPGKKKSSEIAAGLINPIVFRRITFGWRTKKSLTEAKTF